MFIFSSNVNVLNTECSTRYVRGNNENCGILNMLLALLPVNEALAEDATAVDLPFNTSSGYWVPQGPFPVSPNELGKNESGCVLLKFTINESGRVVDPEIVKSFPTQELDSVAFEAISKYKFRPTKNNKERKSARSIFVFTYAGNGRDSGELGAKCLAH